MGKICFIAMTNIYLVPYIKKYTDVIKEDFDVIYWNRNLVEEKIKGKNIYKFEANSNNKIDKFLGYLKFRKFTINILKKNKYKKIIFLHNQIAILMHKFILKNYKKQYIFDIRDYTFENIGLYREIEKKLIENAGVNIISSNGYREFLPANKYIMVHNSSNIEQGNQRCIERNKIKEKIIISNIGLIRFQEQNKKMILAFKNDNRFELRFIGTGANELEEFCVDNEVRNVILIDSFEKNQTLEYFLQTDVIFNLYGNNTSMLEFALSNKLYFAAQLEKPILVCENTYMEKISQKYKFGYTMNLNDKDVLEKFYKYYIELNRDEMSKNCKYFMEKVEKENLEFDKIVKKFIGNS